MYREVEADERERLLGLLGVESEVASAYAGLGPDDTMVGYGPDGYEE